ncbi:MAG: hypothetical protein AAB449_00250 [Patescibacteria group bacterium]
MQYYKGEQIFYTSDGYVSLGAMYIPHLPNAGFAPLSGASITFAVVVLVAAAIAAYPYVRKTVTALRG